MKQLILASTSPRRKEVLSVTGLDFEVVPSDYEEDLTLDMEPAALAEHLSHGKASDVAGKHPDALVIGADTVVAHRGEVLGKPHTEERAREMLEQLKGQTNDIISGVTLIEEGAGKTLSFHGITRVVMKDYSAEEIEAYIATGEPLDKAGAYAIQEKGAFLVERIEGEFFNAMGLPLNRLGEALEEFGISVWQ